MNHNPIQTLFFDPTGTLLGAKDALTLPNIEGILEQAILDLLGQIDQFTGLDLIAFAQALKALFGGSENLLIALLDSIPVIGPIIAVLTGTNPISSLAGATQQFTQFILDMVQVLGNPLHLGTGNPVVVGLLNTIPILIPVLTALQQDLINPVVGTIENALPWVLPFTIGGATTLTDLGTFINNLATQNELQELRDLIHNTLLGNTGSNWVQGVTKTALANTLQAVQTDVQAATVVAQTALTQVQQIPATITPTVQNAIANAQIAGNQIIGLIPKPAIPDVTIAMSSGVQTLATDIWNNLLGLQNTIRPAAHTDAAVALAQSAATTTANQQRLATIGNGAEEIVDVEFSTYTNGSLPGVFSAFSSSGTAMSISGGLCVLTAASSFEYVRYNAAATLTDYQQVSGIWPTLSSASTAQVSLFGRLNTGTTSYVQCLYDTSSAAWTIQGVNTSLVFAVTFNDVFTPGATYTLVCGDPSVLNAYKFQILKNGTPLALTSVTTGDTSQPAGQLYYIDTGHVSVVGGSNRSCGMGMQTGSGSNSIAMSSFLFQDTTQSQPAVIVTASESTTSTTYTDLATISDQVVVNIGSLGMAQVSIYTMFSNSVADGDSFVGFAASGANTIAASDAASILANPVGSGHNQRFGATFLLTGLSPGLTTFKMKYKAQSGTTATFQDRRLGVLAV